MRSVGTQISLLDGASLTFKKPQKTISGLLQVIQQLYEVCCRKSRTSQEQVQELSQQQGCLKWNIYWVISCLGPQDCTATVSHKTTTKTPTKRPHVSAEYCRWTSSERIAAAYDCNINNSTQQRCCYWFMFTFNPRRKRGRREKKKKR